MADEKTPTTDPDAETAAEADKQDEAKKRDAANPGYSRYRKTRQFGG
jgi:hypothetical protein